MKGMTSAWKRKKERGVGMIEILIGMGITAAIIVLAFGVVEEVRDRMAANSQAPYVMQLAQSAETNLLRTHRANCDGDTGPVTDVFTSALGADASVFRNYAATTAGGWGANLVTTNNADAPCRRMHQALRSMLKSTAEGGAAGALYDEDDTTEWFIGSQSGGWDVGVAYNATPIANIGVTGLIPGTLTNGIQCPAGTDLAFAVATRNVDVCDMLVPRVDEIAEAVGCVAIPEGTTNVDGEAALIMCH